MQLPPTPQQSRLCSHPDLTLISARPIEAGCRTYDGSAQVAVGLLELLSVWAPVRVQGQEGG